MFCFSLSSEDCFQPFHLRPSPHLGAHLLLCPLLPSAWDFCRAAGKGNRANGGCARGSGGRTRTLAERPGMPRSALPCPSSHWKMASLHFPASPSLDPARGQYTQTLRQHQAHTPFAPPPAAQLSRVGVGSGPGPGPAPSRRRSAPRPAPPLSTNLRCFPRVRFAPPSGRARFCTSAGVRVRAAARPGGAQARTDPGGGGDAAGAVHGVRQGPCMAERRRRSSERGEARRDETRQDGGPRRERPAGPVQVLTRRQVPGPTAADPHLWSAARRVQCGVPGVWGGYGRPCRRGAAAVAKPF